MGDYQTVIDFFNVIIWGAGTITTVALIISVILAVIAWCRGIITPLWRLGLGLSRREVTIVGSTENCNSLSSMIKHSRLFNTRNIHFVTSKKDAKDLKKCGLILMQLNNSPLTIKEVLDNKQSESALVIYAKLGEIKDEWDLLDDHRNVSVTNLRGRLMNDLLTTLMTTGYEKRQI